MPVALLNLQLSPPTLTLPPLGGGNNRKSLRGSNDGESLGGGNNRKSLRGGNDGESLEGGNRAVPACYRQFN